MSELSRIYARLAQMLINDRLNTLKPEGDSEAQEIINESLDLVIEQAKATGIALGLYKGDDKPVVLPAATDDYENDGGVK